MNSLLNITKCLLVFEYTIGCKVKGVLKVHPFTGENNQDPLRHHKVLCKLFDQFHNFLLQSTVFLLI